MNSPNPYAGFPSKLVCPICGSERIAVVIANVHQAGLETSVTRQKTETIDTRKYPGKGYCVSLFFCCKTNGHFFTIDVESSEPDEVTIRCSDPDEICTVEQIDGAEFARNEKPYIPPEFKKKKMVEIRDLFHRAEEETEPKQRACLWFKCAQAARTQLSEDIKAQVLCTLKDMDDGAANKLANKIRRAIERQAMEAK